ncbi:MAG: replication initiator protein [Microvirus sp.]|nr:MAG: replication initiator protein [Microvirus sp.]
MTCDAPIQGYFGPVNPETGKRPLQFGLQGSFTGVRQMVPCGRCLGCRLDRARSWGLRIMHESKMHAQNTFLTLTYNRENLPLVGTLVPAHLQGFHKRLHNRLLDARGVGIRYYGVGEYGDISRRPHYHSIVFGFDFPDKLMWNENSKGEKLYTSKLLDEIWGFGDCKIAAVSYASAFYVARYCCKKVDGKQREAGHYEVYDADGVIHERVPEFAHMSRRPGIGSSYFDKYGREVRVHDSVILNGHEVPSVRYYDLKIAAEDERALELIKKGRRAKRVWSERQVDRRRTKEELKRLTHKQKVRPI